MYLILTRIIDALAKYQAATGAVLDDDTGLLRITSAQFSALQSLFFDIGGVEFELTANAQLWPVSTPDIPHILVVHCGSSYHV